MKSYKPKRKYKRSVKSRALTTTRGGFIRPQDEIKKIVYGAARSQFNKYAKKGRNVSLDMAKKIVQQWKLPDAVKPIQSVVVGTIEGAKDNTVLNTDAPMPSIVSSQTLKRSVGNLTNLGQLHRTKWVCGRPTSRTLKTFGRQSGVITKWLRDSQFLNYAAGGTADRVGLSRGAGFNQKGWVVYGDGQNTIQGIMEGCGIFPSTYDYAVYNLQNNYVGITKIMNEFTVMNTGSYFPTNVTIRAVLPLSPTANASSLLASAFPTGTEFTAAATNTPKIPNFLWQQGRENSDGNYSVHADPTAKLTMAPQFNNEFKIVKSFTKKLKPGDQWKFSCEQECGPGIDLQKMQRVYDQQLDAAMGLMFVIEHVGVPCEAIDANTSSNSYLGTSPTFLQFDFRHGLQYVQTSNTGSGFFEDESTGGGIVEPRALIRTFQKFQNESATGARQRRYFFNASQIGQKGDSGIAAYIPVLSDKETKYAKSA